MIYGTRLASFSLCYRCITRLTAPSECGIFWPVQRYIENIAKDVESDE